MVSVGSVTVDVVPDARRFDSTLGAQITPQANRIGEQIGQQIADQISKGLRKGLGDWPTDNPAKEPAKRKGQEAAGAFGDAFKGRLRAALADLPDIKIDADSSDADRALVAVRTELQALHDAKLGVDINTTDALAKADALRARLDALGVDSADIRLQVDTHSASAELDKFLAEYRVKTEAAGEEDGSLLAKGMRDSFVRNSPLIAAAVAGGLLAGAPAVLAGAGLLFTGVAAAAVHSNADVQSAFAGTKTTITSTFTNAASVTVPMFVGALGRIGSAIQALGPQLHTAFAALSGPIDSLTTGLISMTNNVMPGLVAAVRNASPVFDGLASLMGSIGTGLGQMFQILSEHSGAAGSVLSSLGSILGSLLPILGQLVGAGAELGAQILPPIAAALHVVADALNVVAPILPAVLAGFLAFKAIGLLSGPLGLLSAKLQTVAADAEGMGVKLAGGAASGVSKVVSALPALGLAVGVVGAAWELQSRQIDSWAKALLDGGAAAEQATSQMKQQATVVGQLDSGFQGFLGHLTGYGTAMDATAAGQDKAKRSAQDLYNAMTPLEKANQDVTKAQNDYLDAAGKWGANSGQAVAASDSYRDAQQHLKDVQDQLAQATHGVTQAMIDQANEALAAADSGFALQRATLASKDAQLAMVDAIKKHGPASEEAQKATLDFNQALLQQAEAAGKAAADQSGLTDKVDLAKVSNAATLQSLLDLKQQYGAEFPAALQQTIDRLQAAGVKVDDVGAKKAVPTVDANTAPLDAKTLAANGQLNDLAAKRTDPVVTLNKAPFDANYLAGLNNLGILDRARANPTASLVDNASAHLLTIKGYIDALHDKTITINTNHNDIYSNYTAPGSGSSKPVATGGRIGGVPSKRFSLGGLVRGPGGPTDDRVGPFWSPSGAVFLSNDETVIKASSSIKYGPQKMAAINAGTATVMAPGYNGGSGMAYSAAPQHTMSGGSGGGSLGPVTVYAQFGDETIEARSVRVVTDALNVIHDRTVYSS